MEDYRRFSHETWESVAPGWERWRDHREEATASVREWLLRALSPQAGQTVLELAAGSGEVGFGVAPMLGKSGRLISTDFSAAMVDAARRRGAQLGLDNVEYRVMDAEHIDLADDSVDGVLCRFGFMLMADAAAALSETRRVLRPDGRLVLAVWASLDRNPWAAAGVRMLVERGHVPPPDPSLPGPFSMGDGERLHARLEAAGFSDVHTEEMAVRFAFRDGDDYLRFGADTAGPFASAIRALSAAERQAIAADLFHNTFAPFATNDRYELPGLALVTIAR